MNDLDSNKDNEVDFNEFVVLVAALTVACNDFFQEQQKKKSKDEKKGKWNGCMKVPAHVMLYDALNRLLWTRPHVLMLAVYCQSLVCIKRKLTIK